MVHWCCTLTCSRHSSCAFRRPRPPKSSNFKRHSPSRFRLRLNPSRPTGSRYRRGVIFKDPSNLVSSRWNLSASAPRTTRESTLVTPSARTSLVSMATTTQCFKASQGASRVGFWWASCAFFGNSDRADFVSSSRGIQITVVHAR